MTTSPQVELPLEGRDVVVAVTASIGLNALGAQISAALEQLPPTVTATIRVRHGEGPVLVVAEVWTAPAGSGDLRRLCDLPAAAGLRMGLVERALDQARVSYPRADLGLRARWRRVTGGGEVLGYELAVSARKRKGDQDLAESQDPGDG